MNEEEDDDLDFPDDGEFESGTGVGAATAVAVGLPMVTAGIALAGGAALGAIAVWLVMRGEPEKVEVPRDLTEDELKTACAPLLERALDDLDNAEKKVESLEGKVNTKQSEITDLEEEMKRRAQRGALLVEERNALRVQLEQAKKELKTLEKRLEIAIEEKELLQEELEVTKVELEDQKGKTYVAREDALDYKWRDFIGNSQLEICERGNRKKMGRCRETVEEQMDPFKDKFDHCVRSGQAVPAIREFNRKEIDELPQFAEYINEEERITKDWYVLLCDPTLPEADDWNPSTAPTATLKTKADEDGEQLSEFDDLPDLEDVDE